MTLIELLEGPLWTVSAIVFVVFAAFRLIVILFTGRREAEARPAGSPSALGSDPALGLHHCGPIRLRRPDRALAAPLRGSRGAADLAPGRSSRRRADLHRHAYGLHGARRAERIPARAASGAGRTVADLFPLLEPDAHIHLALLARLHRRHGRAAGHQGIGGHGHDERYRRKAPQFRQAARSSR